MFLVISLAWFLFPSGEASAWGAWVTTCSSVDVIIHGDPVTVSWAGSCGSGASVFYPSSSQSWCNTCFGSEEGGHWASRSAGVDVTVLEPTCGNTAAGYSLPSPLCAIGVARSVSSPVDGSPFTWTCGSNNGAYTVSCSKPRKADASCGSAEGYKHAFASFDGGGAPCKSRDASLTWVPTYSAPSNLPLNGYKWTWTCYGLNGGSNSPQCSALRIANGVCSTPPNAAPPTSDTDPTLRAPGNPPAAPLCVDGEPQSGAPFSSGSDYAVPNQWYWSCVGQNGGSTANCKAWCDFDCKPELHCDTETRWKVKNDCSWGKTVDCYVPTGGTRPGGCNLNYREPKLGL